MKNVKLNLKDSNVKVIFIIAACGIALAILTLIIYLNFGSILGLFDGSDDPVRGNNTDPNFVPEISDNTETMLGDVYYLNPVDVLESINIRNSYVRKLSVETYHDDDKFNSEYTLTKKDKLYKIESLTSTTAFDGEYLYITSDIYSYKATSDGTEMYSEIGITSLDDVIAMAEKYNSQFVLSGDKKSLYLEIVDNGKSTKSMYEISVETGIVVSEAHYYNGIMNIKVITESIDVFGANNLTSDYFRVSE